MSQFNEWWQSIWEIMRAWVDMVWLSPAALWVRGWVAYLQCMVEAWFWDVPAVWRWSALGIGLVLVGVAGFWRWARRIIMKQHLQAQVDVLRAVLALIHAGRNVDIQGMGPVDGARKNLKTVFFRHQIFVVADVAVRKEMRQLIERADDDAARFVQRPEFANIYRLQTLVEAQIRQQPGWVRTLQWVTSDVWYQLWRRR